MASAESRDSLACEFTDNVCRGCLFVSPKGFSATDDKTLQYFTEISKINILKDTRLPHRFCNDCLKCIKQFSKFKNRCRNSNKILSQLLRTSFTYCGQFDLNDLRKERKKYFEDINTLTLSNTLTVECVETNAIDGKQNVFTNNIKSVIKNQPVPLEKIAYVQHNLSNDAYCIENGVTRSYTPSSDDLKLIDLVDNTCPEKMYNEVSDKFFVIDSLEPGSTCYNSNYKEDVSLKDETVVKKEVNVDFDVGFGDDFDRNSLSPSSIKDELSDAENDDVILETTRKLSKRIALLNTRRKSAKSKSKDASLSRSKVTKKVSSKGIGRSKKSRSKSDASSKEEADKKVRKVYYTFDEAMVNISRPTVEEQIQHLEELKKTKRYVEAKYKCHLCAKWYNYEHSWKSHLVRHEESTGKYMCWICRQRFGTSSGLRSHQHVHQERLECKQCLKVMSGRSAMAEHVAKHNGTAHTPVCDVCGTISMTMSSYYKHMRSHRPEQLEYKCMHCPKTFQYLNSRNDHVARIHTGRKDFTCEICNMSFVNQNGLRSHSTSHSDRKDFYCVECDKNFKTKSALQNHLNVSNSHGDPAKLKFKCDQCNKRFDTIRKLNLHIDCTHLHIFKWSCDKCPARFLTASGLRHHRERIHVGKVLPKKYPCKSCEKAFTSKSMLEKHILTHTGEKPHSCEICGRPFRQKSALETHIKLVHLKLKRPFNKRANKSIINVTNALAQNRSSCIMDSVSSNSQHYSEEVLRDDRHRL